MNTFANWVFSSPTRRRFLIRLWRVSLRLDRASVAEAALIVRGSSGDILVLVSDSAEMRLPRRLLDAWRPIALQVEEWLGEFDRQASAPSLCTIDGSPGDEGLTFVFEAKLNAIRNGQNDELWLRPEAFHLLCTRDRRLVGAK